MLAALANPEGLPNKGGRTLLKQCFMPFVASAFLFVAPAISGDLTVGHSTWVGYGPFYVAQEIGFFAEEGVTV